MSQREDGRGEVTVTIIVQDWAQPILPTEFLRIGYDFDTAEEAAVYRQDWLNFLSRRPLPDDPVYRPFPRKAEPTEDELLAAVDRATEEKLPNDLEIVEPLQPEVEELDVPSFMQPVAS